jgi:competence protein ComEC
MTKNRLFLLIIILVSFFVALLLIINNNKDKKKQQTPVESSYAFKEKDFSGIPDFYIRKFADNPKEAIEKYNDSWRIHFIDVGQGDAILIQGEGKNILIDGGRTADAHNYLIGLEIDTLHWVIATHAHADHIGGLVHIFRHYPVLKVMDNGMSHTSQLYRTYRSLIDSIQAPYIRGYNGFTHSFSEDFVMDVLHPDTLTTYSVNNASLVLSFQMGLIRTLLTGDVESTGEMAILQRNEDVESHILKVAHHGSKTSSRMEFLSEVNPKISIISCAKDNSYGFPHNETMLALTNQGSKTSRTDIHGNILAVVAGEEYEIYEELTTIFEFTDEIIPQKVNINTADINDLIKIIHIGDAAAKEIIANRPFGCLEDLKRVRGIGPKRISDIKEQDLAVVF